MVAECENRITSLIRRSRSTIECRSLLSQCFERNVSNGCIHTSDSSSVEVLYFIRFRRSCITAFISSSRVDSLEIPCAPLSRKKDTYVDPEILSSARATPLVDTNNDAFRPLLDDIPLSSMTVMTYINHRGTNNQHDFRTESKACGDSAQIDVWFAFFDDILTSTQISRHETILTTNTSL
ncbi:hypothetical protein CLF_102361 [Clonorchis sinensis]|uniref:Uncharacterized protein n=1 Tax=Clonorchis sinensis TaxID=79923 RepID=G7Y7R3_CLOSI|nr:hypothetical protein CLF_102361 [Clonorchis sinensis]